MISCFYFPVFLPNQLHYTTPFYNTGNLTSHYLTSNKKDEPFSGFGAGGANSSGSGAGNNNAPPVDPNVAMAELGKAEGVCL